VGVMSTGTSPIRESAEGRPVDRNGFYLSKVQIDAGVDAAGEPLVMTRLMMDTFRSAARAHTHTHTLSLSASHTHSSRIFSVHPMLFSARGAHHLSSLSHGHC
jgi:hypothetical protein